MLLRLALCIGFAAASIVAVPRTIWAQEPAQTTPAPDASKAGAAAKPAAEANDPFGEETTLTAQPIVYMKGTGTWDKAFETVTTAFKTLKDFIDKDGLKADGPVMTIFTGTDDSGFQFEAAIPVAEPPKAPANGDIAVGTSPQGRALKFVQIGRAHV